MPRVIHFEILADNPRRASKFYRDAFGWDIETWEGPQGYWLSPPDRTPRPASTAESWTGIFHSP